MISLWLLLSTAACGPTIDETTAASTDDSETEETTGSSSEASTGYESTYSTSGASETGGGNLCEMAASRVVTRFADCGIILEDTGEDPAAECTEMAGLFAQCVAACVEAASCGGLDGSDDDAATEYVGCLLNC